MKKLLLVPIFGLVSMMAFSQCPPASALGAPYVETFNGVTTGNYTTFSNCWTQSSTTAPNWRAQIGQTGSFNTGPSGGRTSDSTVFGGNYMYLEASSFSSTPMNLETPDINLTGLTTPELTFYYHMYGTTMGTLQVEIYNSTTSSWDSVWSISGQQHTSLTAPWKLKTISLSSYSSKTIQVRFRGIRGTSFSGDMAIDDIRIDNAPNANCATPNTVVFTNISATSAVAHWNSTGTSFTVEYGLSGFSQGTGIVITTTTDSAVLAGLTANTTYDVLVRNNCGTQGNSLYTLPGTFTTSCAVLQTPVVENFDGLPTGNSINPSLPNCWDYVETPSAAGYGYTYGFVSNSPSNSFRLYNSNNVTAPIDTMFLVSPEIMGLDSGTKQITFYGRAGSTWSGIHKINVGTVNNAGDISSFNLITTITLSTTPLAFDEYIVLLDSNSGNNLGHTRIALMHGNVQNYQSVYIDDVKIEDIPPCPKPISFVLDFVTNDSAGIAWTGIGVKYQGEYGLTGFTQSTGSFFTALQTSDTLFGLAGNTTYDVYLQNDCKGSNNGTSVWAGPFTFTTLCDPFTGTTTENFDATVGSNSGNNKMPACWSYYETSGTGYGYVYNSSFYARSPTQMLRLYNGFAQATGDTIMAISPQFTDMPTANKQLRLWLRTISSFLPDQLIIGTVAAPDDPGSLVIIDTLPAATTTWTEYLTRIDAASGYNGTHEYIVMMHANNSGNFKTLLIDDVGIELIPSCIASTGINAGNITQDSALIGWTPGGGSVFEIEYGVAGFTQGTGAVVTGLTDSSAAIGGLTAQTCYDVYLRDSCSSGYSPWTGPFTFCTPCWAKVTPLTENFDNTAVGNPLNRTKPDCWESFFTGNAYSYVYSSTWNPANSLPNMYYMYNRNSFTTGDTLMFISPEIVELDSSNKMVKFYARHSSTFNKGSIVVGTVAAQDDPASFVALDTIDLDIGFKEYSVIMHPALGYNGTDKFVAFAHANLKNFQPLYIDDISIEKVPLCSIPFNLGVGTITATSAVTNWSSVYTQGNNFKMEYGLAGFFQATGNGTYISNTGSSTTITGLTPNTWYDYYVADNCDSNTWAGPSTFKTECLGQLSGTYTIGGTAGPANFATLDSAVAVLAGCGVSGAVTFNFQGGTYPAASIILGTIQGASSSNTITFNGGGISVDTIDLNVGVTIGIEMDGSSFITFQNLTIDAVGANRVVWLHNNAHHITFDNCHLLGTTFSSSLYGVVVAAETATSISSFGNTTNNLTIKGCLISGGYAGVVLNGSSSASYIKNNTIEDNVFKNQSTYGIDVYYNESIDIKNNTISGLSNTFGYGIFNYYIRDFEFSGNSVFALTYGIYISQGNRFYSPPTQSMLYNNFISASNGLFFSSVENVDILHNSIKGRTRGFYLVGTNDSMDIRNNIIVGGIFEAFDFFYFTIPPNSMTMDYNIYYTNGTNIASWGPSSYANLSAWQTADPLNNDSSLQGNPGFISATDFHVIDTLANDVADNNTTVVIDIDGDSRPMTGSTVKDIGADEYDVLQIDAGVVAIVNPEENVCGDSTIAVTVQFFNYGTDTINSMVVKVSVLGQTLSATYTGSLASGQSDTITVGSFTQIPAATVSFIAYTELANDQKAGNDSLVTSRSISDASAPVGVAMMDTLCMGDSTGLYISSPSEGNFLWTYSNGDTLSTVAADDTIYTGGIVSDTTLTLASISESFLIGNPNDTTGSGGGNYTFFNNRGLVFSVFKTITIDSLTVYPNAAGNVYVNVANSFGTILQTAIVPTTATGNMPERIYVGLTVTPGNYRLIANGTTTGGLYRSYGHITFPFMAANGSMQITNGTSNGYNYFFYNWKVTVYSCQRPDGMTSVNVLPSASASFNYTVGSPTASDQTVNFDGSGSVADSLIWSFGDGIIDFGTNPIHAYGTNGTWIVTLVAINACGSDTITDTIVTYGIGIDEGLIGETLMVYPNPNDGVFRVDFELEGLKDLEIRITDVTGKLVYSKDVGKASGAYRENIDISNYAKGMYLLQIKTNNVVVSRRVTIQ